jgi:hypothetical protein
MISAVIMWASQATVDKPHGGPGVSCVPGRGWNTQDEKPQLAPLRTAWDLEIHQNLCYHTADIQVGCGEVEDWVLFCKDLRLDRGWSSTIPKEDFPPW